MLTWTRCPGHSGNPLTKNEFDVLLCERWRKIQRELKRRELDMIACVVYGRRTVATEFAGNRQNLLTIFDL